MLALLYDIHGNLPALEAVLDDARGRGARRWLLGGDMAPFGAWPAETLQRLRELDHATWIRGNTERWLVDRSDLPADQPMAAAVDACREALGDAVADELGALPDHAPLGDETVAWHGSPVSDMRSFAPEPADDEGELLRGRRRPPADLRPHPPAVPPPRRRQRAVDLLNPGSVGVPLDGDHRAAYALVDDDGEVVLRRVAYDHAASAQALRDRFGDAEWVAIVSGRIERAALG